MIRLLPALPGLLLLAPSLLHASQARTATWSRQITDEERLRVRVEFGAGKLTLRPGAPSLLYHATYDFDERLVTPELSYRDGRLEVGMDGERNWRFRVSGEIRNALDLALSTGLPIDLEVDFGAGEAELDLSGIALHGLEVNTGASESRIRVDEPNPEPMSAASFNVGAADFSLRGLGNLNAKRVEINAGMGSVTLDLNGAWPADARLEVDMGLGALTIRIPEALGARIRLDNMLTANSGLDGFARDGREYHSPNWERADRKVEIEISAALGSVEIERIP